MVGCVDTRCAEAETCCAEPRCAEVFGGRDAGVSAAFVVVNLGRTVRDVRLQGMVPVLSARDGKKEI